MAFFDDIVTSTHSNIIISVIWGLGLATLFRKACHGRNCIIIKTAEPAEIKGNVYKFNSKCYKFDPEITNCNSK